MIEYESSGWYAAMAARHMAGHLDDMRPTDHELRMVQLFPNDSPLLHAWIGTNGNKIVVDQPGEGVAHAADASFYQGQVVSPGGEVLTRFEYRAQPAGPISRATARALGWLMGNAITPRGWLSGRVYTDHEPGAC